MPEQEAAVAAGTLSLGRGVALRVFPPLFVAAVDRAPEAYEQEIASLHPLTDEAVRVEGGL